MPGYEHSEEYRCRQLEQAAKERERKATRDRETALDLLECSVQAFNVWRKRHHSQELGLWGVNLSGRNLTGVNFADVDLTNADLSRCDLTDANLKGATLTGCRLEGTRGVADLVTTSLAELLRRSVKGFNARRRSFRKEKPDLSNEDFSGLKLVGADLSRCDLTGANFRKAILCRADFTNATLPDAGNFAGANVREARFTKDNLDAKMLIAFIRCGYRDLEDVNLSGQDLSGLDLTECDLDNADLSKCILKGVHIRASQLRFGPNLDGATGTIVLVKEKQ